MQFLSDAYGTDQHARQKFEGVLFFFIIIIIYVLFTLKKLFRVTQQENGILEKADKSTVLKEN